MCSTNALQVFLKECYVGRDMMSQRGIYSPHNMSLAPMGSIWHGTVGGKWAG